MSKKTFTSATMNGNEAAARVAFALSEAAAIYPITPSSDMAEYCDAWSASGKKNVFDTVPKVVQMQSEAGVAGTLHGLLAAGALSTTFTCSQGLLLMIPNMYKIVGELLPTVIHVSARTIAMHALSIFGDHSDVYATRATGFAMLASSNVQETQDMALVAHLASLEASYPFMHFFDGFRTSHEYNKVRVIQPEDMKKLINTESLQKFRERALNPLQPHQSGTAQNPDTFFQNRESANKYIDAVPAIVGKYLKKVGALVGKDYKPFEYIGSPSATNIIVAMGSACDTISSSMRDMPLQHVGLLKVRLYRPFDVAEFIKVLPKTAKTITVLDRTKENGAIGEPLYTDICSALFEFGHKAKALGGRYGLASKEFTPDMVAAIYANAELGNKAKKRFTVGINDDVTHTSLDVDSLNKQHPVPTEQGGYVFYGLGSDGTISANRNSVQIIGDNTSQHGQAYFVYDSKKSGSVTISHLRFSDTPIHKPYLIKSPSFVACHNQTYLRRFDMLDGIKHGGTFLLNTTYTPQELEGVLPPAMKKILLERKINFWTINAYSIARELGLGSRINTIMQSAFFKLANIIPYTKAKTLMKDTAAKTYGKKGERVLNMNYAAIDSAEKGLIKFEISTLQNTQPLDTDTACCGASHKPPQHDVVCHAYYERFCKEVNCLRGDSLSVSTFSPDGRVPTGTSQFEKRNIATSLPRWIPKNCIQCNQCALVCPHATLRPHLLDDKTIKSAPSKFETLSATGIPNKSYRLQLNPLDCTGCGVCAKACPAREKALVMADATNTSADNEVQNYEFSKTIPYPDIEANNVKNSQFRQPLFEFPGACAGCGQTPYLKLVTQLFGHKMIIANATGCTSIYGGSSPICPYSKDSKGRGPAWANSLFEDNAEFGYGIRLAYDARTDATAKKVRDELGNVSVWLIGGDGWAYDIGFGGLDHVISQNENVNILVLDTEVYSNTGGQQSKATPAGAVAKFACGGKPTNKKDLGKMAMTYDNVYIAQVAIGANYAQTLTALQEAAEWNGPSLVIAYATCINHGIDMSNSMQVMKDAVESGYWKLYRRHPQKGLTVDSKPPTKSLDEFYKSQIRFKKIQSQKT